MEHFIIGMVVGVIITASIWILHNWENGEEQQVIKQDDTKDYHDHE